MNDTLAPVLRKCVVVFFDDILIYSKTYEENLSHITQVLQILSDNQWQVKLSKCAFAQQEITYLGHTVSRKGVATDASKIAPLVTWPAPTTIKQVRGFLGMIGYYRKFIKNYGVICKPLTNLLKKGVVFVWTSEPEVAFQTLKTALITAPVLALPDFSKEFIIQSDASECGIGAVLMQDAHPLAYVSRALGPKNQTLTVYEKEYLAILLAIQQWRPYLQMKEFTILTDQKSLCSLTDQRIHKNWQQKALTKLMGLQYKIVYKKGVDNRVADALSRRPTEQLEVLVVSVVQPIWLQQIIDSYAHDSYALKLLQQLAIDPDSHKSFVLKEGVLRYKQCIWVGADANIQNKIITAFHASGHSGFLVTYKRILSLFRWTGLKNHVHKFAATCQVCQQAKPESVQYPGLLQPLAVPPSAWHTVSMDFIHGLPTSSRFNCILVIIDSFSKYGHFVPLRHPFTAAKVAKVFMDTVFKLHSLPAAVVTDRDPLFTSTFWQGIFDRLNTQLCMSSSYHPQSDGQTEQVNQAVECYLRCFISAHPAKWSLWLSLCEFWYNTNWHSATGQTPFEVLYGHPPRYFGL